MAGWTGASRGAYLGNLFFVVAVRFFGRWPAYFVATVVAAVFLILAPSATYASRRYLLHVRGRAPLRDVWTHFRTFSLSLVDRLLHRAQGDAAFQIESEGLHHIQPRTLLVTAHTNNWELAAGPLKNGMASIAIARALRAGEVVALQGDRCVDYRVIWCPFLGEPAPFPMGLWLLAGAAQCPVVAAFGSRLEGGRYRFQAFPRPAQEGRGRPAAEAKARWYVRTLEDWVRKTPYQWFNFCDFWTVPVPPSRAPMEPA